MRVAGHGTKRTRFWPSAGSWSEAPTISGSWQLRVVDSAEGNAGRLNDWSVTLNEVDP